MGWVLCVVANSHSVVAISHSNKEQPDATSNLLSERLLAATMAMSAKIEARASACDDFRRR